MSAFWLEASTQFLGYAHNVHFARIKLWKWYDLKALIQSFIKNLYQKREIVGYIKLFSHTKNYLGWLRPICFTRNLSNANQQICFKICLVSWSIHSMTILSGQFCERLWKTVQQKNNRKIQKGKIRSFVMSWSFTRKDYSIILKKILMRYIW